MAENNNNTNELIIAAGTKVSISNASSYAFYDARTSNYKYSGIYYVYNDKIRNNRIRLCDNIDKVNKPCMRTGWFNLSDITIIEEEGEENNTD